VTLLSCDRQNEIKVRKKDGSQHTIRRCADPGCAYFTQEVTDQCTQCVQRRVEVEVPKTPNLVHRVATWAEASAGWAAAGLPVRSDAEVQRIFDTFCTACSWYDSVRRLCRGCGCGVNVSGMALFNKIKMATQNCPQHLW